MLIKEKIPVESKQGINDLFLRYYQSDSRSAVTSSHWAIYGAQNSVKRVGDNIALDGHGFGIFVRPGSLRHAKYFMPSYLSRQLLQAYDVDQDIVGFGDELGRKQQRLLMFDEVKQLIICDILKKRGVLAQCKVITVIGDGYGFMASLMKLAVPQAKIIVVNLGKMLLFDYLYASKAFSGMKMALWQGADDYQDLLSRNEMLFLEAEKYEMLYGRDVDLFINVASMQEMDPGVIKTYFDIIRSGKGKRYFYACNREKKVMPDGTTVCFDTYPWDLKRDEIIFDEMCPFYQKYPASLPPFWRNFSSTVKHRLAKMEQGI